MRDDDLKIYLFVKDKLKSGVQIIAFGETNHGSHDTVFRELFDGENLFKGIFLELSNDYQSSIDFFLQNGNFDEKLERTIAGALKEGKNIRNNLELILFFARRNKIPVICIDSSKTQNNEYQTKSEHGYFFLKGKSRNEDMFNIVFETINKVTGKWLIIGGSQHIKYGIHFRSNDETLGSRLNVILKNKFFNISLYNVSDFTATEIFNVRDHQFDGYILHKLERSEFL